MACFGLNAENKYHNLKNSPFKKENYSYFSPSVPIMIGVFAIAGKFLCWVREKHFFSDKNQNNTLMVNCA
mgnify:CR=1 FL=1